MKKRLVRLIVFNVFLLVVSVIGAANSLKQTELIAGKKASTDEKICDFQIIDISKKADEPEVEKVCTLEAPKSPQFTEEEECLLTKVAMAEAGGEDTEGKALVILIILNRVASDSFPDSISEVVYQQNQFSCTYEANWKTIVPDDDCYKALQMVLSGYDTSNNATYFESQSSSTWHRDNLTFLFQHGNHFFYTERSEQVE